MKMLDSVRSYLKHAMPDSQLTSENLHPGYQPLLFMWAKHMVAAFAFSNGDTPKSYEALYGSFKEYYAEQRTQLDAMDLAFVFCVSPDLPNLDQLCSKVEMDVYFCRKFVVPIIQPLETSFARLPFLPLTPVRGQSMRPPSAQTFLRQCGVPAMLAQYLVAPQQRSPEAIVEDCMEARFGNMLPTLVAPTRLDAPTLSSGHAAEKTRLESISIENFRAYRKPQKFDLSADVTVLYGPNGFGKTSFFDAVDFAVTGEIGRLRPRVGRGQFNKIVAHLDSTPKNSIVSLGFTSNGAMRKVTRQVSSRMQPLLDGRRCDRKTILAELTGGGVASVDRIEHLVSLFRATHLFSQEYQELAKGFESNCALSEPIVSHMLAFEDYARASKKASRVRDVAQERVGRARDDIREFSEEVAAAKRELDHLDQTSQEHITTSTLDHAVTSLRRKVKEAGITVPTGESDLAFARACRAAVAAKHSESLARTERLSVIAKQVADMPAAVEDLARLREKQARSKRELAASETALAAAEQEQKRKDLLFGEADARRLKAQARLELLEWVTATQPRYAQILQRQRDSAEELKRATSTLDQLRRVEPKTVSKWRAQERKAEGPRAKLERSRSVLVALQALVNAATSWKADRIRISAIEAAESGSLKTLEKQRLEEKTLSSQLAKNAASEDRVRRRIDEAHRTQSELRQLLSRLEGHVQSDSCPLCGQEHGSKSKLLSRIRRQVTEDTVGDARVELAHVQEAGARLSRKIESARSRVDHESTTIKELRQERAELAESIGAFEAEAVKLGIAIEETDVTSHEVMNRHAQAREDVLRFDLLVQKDQDELAESRAKVDDLRGRIAKAEEAVAGAEAAVERSQAEATRLRGDPRAAQISLDTDPLRLADLDNRHRGQLSEANAAFANSKKAAKKSRDAADGHRQRAKSLGADLGALRYEISNLKKTIMETKIRLEESKLPSDAAEAAVFRSMEEEARTNAQLLKLRDLAVSLELAIDTATTAAALRHQSQVIRQKERAIERVKQAVQLYQPWLTYFDQLIDLVSSQQHEAIANFTREYGPRTSVIQRRLRAVYGFDEIDIRSYESTIRVRVKRASEELRPTNYFSQSQQQTLLLGLFLTACISQTWSALPTVFFDDPVTHFDDLNTYAFLDLILGLLDSESEPRQFIISTCDEKILHLSRQKFRHLGKNARFYAFSAIDADGPAVEELAPAPSG